MSMILSFSPDTERKLKERALRAGQSVESFIEQIVEREMRAADGGIRSSDRDPASESVPALPSDKVLAAFRREVKTSGMSDEEVRAFFEEVREEVYRETHGQPSQLP